MKSYQQYKDAELCNISNWHKLIKLKREEVVALHDAWKATEKLNKEIYEENKTIRANIAQSVEKILTENGIEYKVKFYFGSRSKKKFQPFYEKFIEHISGLNSYIPHYFPYAHMGEAEIQGVKVSNCCSPTPVLGLYDGLTRQVEQTLKRERVNENHFIECVKQAALNNLDIQNLNKEEIVGKVEEFLKDKFMREEYPDGTQVEIDDNHCECESYNIGDRRCECGNRRISAYIEGNCLNGYYLTTEPY